MKVKTIKHVNIRSGAAQFNAPLKGTLNPGFEIEVEKIRGESIEGNDVWYVDGNGDFLWSGGFVVTEAPAIAPAIKLSERIDYSRAVLSAHPDLDKTNGKGIKVAVIDSGIYQGHPDFAGAVPAANVADFTNSKERANDLQGHGTHCAGLIGARTPEASGIIGVAPECELFAVKVMYDAGGASADAIKSALEWCVQQEIDVINLSFDVGRADYEKLKVPLTQAAQSGAILVGAAGNNELLTTKWRSFLLPAADPNVLSVGAIKRSFVDEKPGLEFLAALDFVMPFIELKSTAPEQRGRYSSNGGSSMATAIVSGIVALAASRLKQQGKYKLDEVKSELRRMAVPYRNDLPLDGITLVDPERRT
jgi:subtilisin family serine protease